MEGAAGEAAEAEVVTARHPLPAPLVWVLAPVAGGAWLTGLRYRQRMPVLAPAVPATRGRWAGGGAVGGAGGGAVGGAGGGAVGGAGGGAGRCR